MLVLALLVPALVTAEYLSDTNYTIKQTDSCPDVGYYFKRELPSNYLDPGPCFLCFCQGNGTAACWRRENRRCDAESYHYHGIGKRGTRVRRGLALGDIFFRDATRDLFNKRLPEQCKPYESSFSDGCPPVDWCIGCTVCDCDANGHWDCRVLSYCPERTTKKPKKRGGSFRRTVIRKMPIKTTPVTTVKPKTKKPTTKKPAPNKPVTKKPSIKKLQTTKRRNINRLKRQPPNNAKLQKTNKFVAPQKPVKKIIKNNSVKPKPTGRDTKSPTNPQITLSSTSQFAQEAIRKVLEAMQHFIRNDVKKGNSSLILKAIEAERIEADINKDKTLTRHKREVGKTVDVTESLGFSTDMTNNMENVSQIESLLNASTHVTTEESLLISTHSPYYSYYLENNSQTINETAEILNNNETKINLTAVFYNETKPHTFRNQSLESMDDALRNANDLKFKDWPQIKFYKGNRKLLKLELIKFDNFGNNYNKTKANYTDATTNKRKVTKKFVRRIKEKKNNIKKVIKTSKNKRDETQITAIDKIKNLQNKFKSILNHITSNASTVKPKLKKHIFIKQIKRLFNKIISKKVKKHDERGNTLKIICQEFGPCNFDKNQKRLVNIKVIQLNIEISNILRTIEIIKGLLKLMNIPNKTTNSKTKVNDFHTLNLILNGNIDVADYNLTQTEKTQVDYIKMNTQLFVKSVGKFAKILQDIIVIVRKNKQQSTETNKAIVKPRNKVINDRYKKNKDDNMFDAFKGLLRAYDLIHNSFVKKMYKIIKTIENVNKKQSVKRKLSTFDNLPRVRNVNKTNNISEILEKLTGLEGRIKLRSKRDVRRDDAVEYLLTVMEFLLKQNYRLDSNPADDGIDLLLDAIRNTPDIKTTKKKVLEDVSIGTNAFPNSVKLDKLTEDSVLKSETDSKYVESEEKKTIVSTTDNVEASEDDDDRDYDDKYVFNRRVKKVKNDTKIASTTENTIHTTNSIRLNPDSSKLQMINFEISNNDDQKYDVYIADKDVIFNTSTEITTSDQGIRKAASDDEIIDATQSINMSKLDWFGDNDKEIREVRSEKNKIESSTSTDTPVSTRSTKIVEDNISGITKEIKEEEKKTKSIEQIMVKKQMELLNSLDYETERVLTDTSESKDEEKYSEINSYFV